MTREKKMIFMGYDQKNKWYTFYNPNEGNMVICRDVEFNEKEVFYWKIDYSEKYDFILILDEDECHNPIMGYSLKFTFFFQNKNQKNKIKANNVEKVSRGIQLQFWRKFKV